MKTLIQEINSFEVKHKIFSFMIILITTILITRIITPVFDPNIFIKNFEIHHFYYGIILLIITSLLMLYKKRKFKIFLPLVAISIGLIIDEFLFISGKIRGPIAYSSTFLSTIILILIILITIKLIFKIKK